MTLNDGIRIYLKQVIMDRGLPFRPVVVKEPNEETLLAMRESENKLGRAVTRSELREMMGL